MSYWATEAAGGENPLGGLDMKSVLAQAAQSRDGAVNGGSVLVNGKWVMPQYGNARWEGQGQDAVLVAGEPTEYWVADDLGKSSSGGYGGGGSAQYEGKPYHRIDPQGNYIGSENYKNMGTDGFTKVGAWLSALGGAVVAGAAIAGAGAAGAGGGGLGNGAFLGEAAWAPTVGGAPLEFGAGTALSGGTGGLSAAEMAAIAEGGIGDAALGTAASNTATMGAGAGGGGLSSVGGEVLSKAALDGTTAFGANSAAGALDISALSAATTPAAAQQALTKMAADMGYTGLTTTALQQIASKIPTDLLSKVPDLTNLLGPAAALVGGIVSGNAADKSAEQQAQAARDDLALRERMFNKTIELNEPFRATGVQAVNRLGDLTGVSGRTGAEGYGDLVRNFSMETDYLQDPGYLFRKAETEKALERRLSAGGQLYSGKALKDSMAHAGGLASEEFGNSWNRWNTTQGNTFNRLASLSGTGQTATGQVGNAAQNYASGGGAAIQNAGDARAAGTVGRANALSDGISQGYSMYQDQVMTDRVLRARGY